MKSIIISRYYETEDKWYEIGSMVVSRCMMPALSDNKSIYVLGGFNGNEIKSLERYDGMIGKWEEVCELGCDRFMHSAIIIRMQYKEK